MSSSLMNGSRKPNDEQDTILYLNLDNFDCISASECPYVLTSPRSLRACRKANLRPLELLHRSATEIAEELALPEHKIYHIYVNTECQRKKKLELCKMIREDIIRMEKSMMDNNQLNGSSRKQILDMENYAKMTYSNKDDNDAAELNRDFGLRSSLSTPVFKTASNNNDYGNHNDSDKCKSARYFTQISVSTSNSSLSSLMTYTNHNFELIRRSKSAENSGNYCKNYDQNWNQTDGNRKKKNKRQSSNRRQLEEKATREYDRDNKSINKNKFDCKNADKRKAPISREKSHDATVKSKTQQQKDSKMAKRSACSKSTKCSSTDRTVTMFFGKEEDKKRNDSANSDNSGRRKLCSFVDGNGKDSRQKHKIDKRNTTTNVNNGGHKNCKNNRDNGLSTTITIIKDEPEDPEHIPTKTDKFDNQCQSIADHTSEVAESTISPRREEPIYKNINNHDLRILEALTMKHENQMSAQDLAYRSQLLKDAADEQIQRHCSSINDANNYNDGNNKHSADISMDQRNYDLSKMRRKLNDYLHRERTAFQRYVDYMQNRLKYLRENRELHNQHVRHLASELQAGMEQWQDQVMLLQWQALQRAQTNARLHIENKKLRAQCENQERTLLHAQRMKNVKNMQSIKLRGMKEEIEAKNYKIERLRLKREREILECRTQAQNISELRQQLRRTLSPETFDQKVNKVLLESRFIRRSITASPALMQSHIRLG